MVLDIYRCAWAPEIYIAVPESASPPSAVEVEDRRIAAEAWIFLKTLDLQPDGIYIGIDPHRALADIEKTGWHLANDDMKLHS